MKTENTTSANSRTRTITVQGDRIIYTLKHDGVSDYLTYNEDLLQILKQDRLKPFRDGGRLRFKVRINKTDKNYYLYDLAYACYTGAAHADSFVEDMQIYYERKAFNGLSIDHADNNILNNTVLNLSAMPISLNVNKSDIVARVKMPIYLNSAYCNGEYRVQMAFETKTSKLPNIVIKCLKHIGYSIPPQQNNLIKLQFICETAEKYVQCLKWLTTTRFEWAEPLREDNIWVKSNNDCWCAEINNSLFAQKMLSKMPANQLQQFSL
ncbi:MAG: hypothetical protein IKK85_06135 [Clostridia bacterium]|nr:hypothetical protein [Clostridia bacterium]